MLDALETKKGGQETATTSDDAHFDSDKEAQILSKLARAQQAEVKLADPVEQTLRRGIRLQHPLPIPRQVSRFTLKPVGPLSQIEESGNRSRTSGLEDFDTLAPDLQHRPQHQPQSLQQLRAITKHLKTSHTVNRS